MGAGAALAVIGGIGVVLGALGLWSDLGRPWSFLLGFVFGLCGGIGVSLSIAGLLGRRSGD